MLIGSTGFQESTGRICLLELTEHTGLLGLTENKDLKILTGHTSLVKFVDWIDLIFL